MNLHRYSPHVITSRFGATRENSGNTGLNHGRFDRLVGEKPFQVESFNSPSPMTYRAGAAFKALANHADLAEGSLVQKACQLWLPVPTLAGKAANSLLHSEQKCKLHFTVMCKNTGVNLHQKAKTHDFFNPKIILVRYSG